MWYVLVCWCTHFCCIHEKGITNNQKSFSKSNLNSIFCSYNQNENTLWMLVISINIISTNFSNLEMRSILVGCLLIFVAWTKIGNINCPKSCTIYVPFFSSNDKNGNTLWTFVIFTCDPFWSAAALSIFSGVFLVLLALTQIIQIRST